MSPNHTIDLFYSCRFLRWWALCNMLFFQWVWKHPWSKVNKCHFFLSCPFIAFHVAFVSLDVSSFPFIFRSFCIHVPYNIMFLSCCIYFLLFCISFLSCPFHFAFMLHLFPFLFLSFCFHVAFVSFHVPFMFLSCCICFLSVPFILHSFPFILHSFPFMFLSFCIHVLSFSVAMYQTYRSSKSDMLKPVRWVSAQRLVFSICVVYRFCYRLCVLENCAGCHLQGPSTCTCISPLLFVFYSYRFLGR